MFPGQIPSDILWIHAYRKFLVIDQQRQGFWALVHFVVKNVWLYTVHINDLADVILAPVHHQM